MTQVTSSQFISYVTKTPLWLVGLNVTENICRSFSTRHCGPEQLQHQQREHQRIRNKNDIFASSFVSKKCLILLAYPQVLYEGDTQHTGLSEWKYKPVLETNKYNLRM